MQLKLSRDTHSIFPTHRPRIKEITDSYCWLLLFLPRCLPLLPLFTWAVYPQSSQSLGTATGGDKSDAYLSFLGSPRDRSGEVLTDTSAPHALHPSLAQGSPAAPQAHAPQCSGTW